MHEWLSLILLLPFALHLWRNWGSMLGNLRRGWLVVPLGLSLIAALAFAVPALTGKAGNGSPPMQAVSLLTGAQLGDLGPILHESPEALAERLRAHGLPVPSTSASLQEIAAAAGRDARQLLFGLMARR